MLRLQTSLLCLSAVLLLQTAAGAEQGDAAPLAQERVAEWSIESHKAYKDPFNDVDVDVVFEKDGQSWRVPTFWRGGNRWTVRFAPPTPGDYFYHLESTDPGNPDLNGHAGRVSITAYHGSNELLRHGALRVSANKRYFEHADGTPFYWLGDTLWTGLSDRLPWEGFQTLVKDRHDKGFTVVQLCAGLIPSDEERAPIDPGFRDEGGAVWDPQFNRINPQYFDFADRRIQLLVDAGLVPAVVGAWSPNLEQMGAGRIKKHWRYMIARYGAYPVFWVLAGGVLDPPPALAERLKAVTPLTPGWTEIARYVRALDPYHHPLTAHEGMPPFDIALQEDSLTDFDMTQPSHNGWPSIGAEVVQLNSRYARTDLTKPVVVGEVGYEWLEATQLEDFQRVAFWLADLNGAAGFTYGAAPTYEVNNPDKPLHRNGQYSFMTWEEGMNLRGSYQVGLGAKLVRQYPWWQLTPHPEWVSPGGTTLLEPHSGREPLDAKVMQDMMDADFGPTDEFLRVPESVYPGGEWRARQGTFRKPYAAGIPGKLRIIYIPSFGLVSAPPPTVMDLENEVHYQAYYWEPALGIKFDLGTVAVPAPGPVLFQDDFASTHSSGWIEEGAAKATRGSSELRADGATVSVVKKLKLQNAVTAVDGLADSSLGLLLNYQDADNYVAAIYSAKDKALYYIHRDHGVDSAKLGTVATAELSQKVHLRAEARDGFVAASISDGRKTYSTPIVDLRTSVVIPEPASVNKIPPGSVGLLHLDDGHPQRFKHFTVRQSPKIPDDDSLERKLYDARGGYRGELRGPGWDDFGRNKTLLLNAWRPERLPAKQDWVLVLQARTR